MTLADKSRYGKVHRRKSAPKVKAKSACSDQRAPDENRNGLSANFGRGRFMLWLHIG